MAIFAVIVVGPACLFLLYVLAQFFREAMQLRADANRCRARADRILEDSIRRSGDRNATKHSAPVPERHDSGVLAFPRA
jgi:hypothetical protein